MVNHNTKSPRRFMCCSVVEFKMKWGVVGGKGENKRGGVCGLGKVADKEKGRGVSTFSLNCFVCPREC